MRTDADHTLPFGLAAASTRVTPFRVLSHSEFIRTTDRRISGARTCAAPRRSARRRALPARLSASRSNARRPAQASGRTRCARTAPRPRLRAFVGGVNGSPRTPCWESPSARSRGLQNAPGTRGEGGHHSRSLAATRSRGPPPWVASRPPVVSELISLGRWGRIAERRRARRNGLAAKIVRVTAQGMPTNGRRRGLALFEREITASEGEREFAEC